MIPESSAPLHPHLDNQFKREENVSGSVKDIVARALVCYIISRI